MEKLIGFVKTPEFWFGGLVVGTIVGLVVNYISNFLNPKITGFFTWYRKRRATRTEKLNQERETRINLLMKNAQEQHFSISFATNKKISAIIRCVSGTLLGLSALMFIGTLLNMIDEKKTAWEIGKTGVVCFVAAVAAYLLVSNAFDLFHEAESLLDEVCEARRRNAKASV